MGGVLKNVSCWWDDKASPWMLLMGEGARGHLQSPFCCADGTKPPPSASHPICTPRPLTPNHGRRRSLLPFQAARSCCLPSLVGGHAVWGDDNKTEPGKKKQLSLTKTTLTATEDIHKDDVSVCIPERHQNQKHASLNWTVKSVNTDAPAILLIYRWLRLFETNLLDSLLVSQSSFLIPEEEPAATVQKQHIRISMCFTSVQISIDRSSNMNVASVMCQYTPRHLNS